MTSRDEFQHFSMTRQALLFYRSRPMSLPGTSNTSNICGIQTKAYICYNNTTSYGIQSVFFSIPNERSRMLECWDIKLNHRKFPMKFIPCHLVPYEIVYSMHEKKALSIDPVDYSGIEPDPSRMLSERDKPTTPVAL